MHFIHPRFTKEWTTLFYLNSNIPLKKVCVKENCKHDDYKTGYKEVRKEFVMHSYSNSIQDHFLFFQWLQGPTTMHKNRIHTQYGEFPSLMKISG